MEIIEIIRLIAPEFEDTVEDFELEMFIELAKPFVSKEKFGDLYNQAVAYLVCHKLKIAGRGESLIGDMATAASGYSIASISAGQSSISFNAGSSASGSEVDNEYLKTTYGSQFLQIQKLVVVPIAINT